MDEDNEVNELIINDVPETSEQENLEEIETNASEGVEEGQENAKGAERTDEDIEREIEERANKKVEETIEARLVRDRAKRERETEEKFAKYQELENILKAGLGTNNLDETISKTSEFYKGQGVNIPTENKHQSLNERDAIVLAEADAQDIIKCGEKEMEYEANRIASIPREKRTFRENVMFNRLCEELTSMRNVRELQSKGYDTKVLESKEFREFSKDINKPIADVYEMYTKLNGISKTVPKSPRKC